MYYLLNYAPSILYIAVSMTSIKMDIVVFAIIYLFAQPLYLLIVNMPFVYKKSISYVVSIICMLSVIMLNVLYTMIVHKVQTGYFIGDVPEGIYYLMAGIPTLIIVVGVGVIFLISKCNNGE